MLSFVVSGRALTTDIGFNESGIVYTAEDVRFTVKGDDLYATFLDWPGEYAIIRSLRGNDPDMNLVEEEDTPDPDEQKSY